MSTRLHRTALLVALAAATTLGACASSGTAGAGDGTEPAARRNTNRDLLTRGDLAGATHTNLYDAAQALRPHWFRSNVSAAGNPNMPGGNRLGGGGPVVYLQGQLYGAAESLRNISLGDVEQARYLTTSAAQARYGSRVEQPVIDVTLVRR